MDSLINLSLDIQIILVAGYLGFYVATVGRDGGLRPVDIGMQILVYGLLAKLATLLLAEFGLNKPIYQVVGAVIASLVVAAVWRRYLRKIWAKIIRQVGIHVDDHNPSVIASILDETDALWRNVQIYTNDGKVYESNFYKLPAGLPNNNIALDGVGNVSLYVTALYADAHDESPLVFEGHDPKQKCKLTYLPANIIIKMNISWHNK
ncbi:MAG: hypothetical protein COB24_08870 [Hyphomicrobiales bacterium]|nr:MAG: hypothetical protein COB24_08870 [Hyphomicrobiales bacterium]